LSKVMFVTTANVLDTIPAALQDRMEVIEFSGYLEEEKLEICQQFLVPRQLTRHGLQEAGIKFEEDALKTLIRLYTREAGVRNLEREIANVCRKLARMVAEGKKPHRRLTARRVVELLGPQRYTQEILQEQDEVGVATGAAWTMTGGDILFIEVNLMPGKGHLTLTGQLGDVMQESAQAALTYTRSQCEALGIDESLFEKHDIHIHIPEGAVPKDGPSAGVTLATALISAVTERPIRRDVAMTGELTLRGRVLPVGGIREKALAARRAGVTTFILPRQNETDLELIPKKLRQDLEFVLVSRMHEVVDAALLPKATAVKLPRRPVPSPPWQATPPPS
ncbi:MAG: endopeptidase La, partial [Anaerolineales bacterium]|nr:endopeptidase La [Anaerolineales bacterium]